MSDLNLPVASYSFTMRLQIPSKPGSFAAVTKVVGDAGGDLGSIDLVRSTREWTTRDVTVAARNSEHARSIVNAVREVSTVEQVSDRTFLAHLGGKIEMQSRIPINNRDDLSMVYTPGVARVCMSIFENKERSWNLTSRGNTVMILTDGSRVLGLGNIGPEAATPVMEGKAAIFKKFADTNAWPVCLDTQDTEEIIRTAKLLAPNYGAINLEDIESPRCFEIERRLNEELDIPVFHDDQHGTAVAVVAGLLNACRVIDKPLSECKVVMLGAGAAGLASTKLVYSAGARDITVFDSQGVVHKDRGDLHAEQDWLLSHTNINDFRGDLTGALDGADIFVGLAAANALSPEQASQMSDKAIIFALSNPDPEIQPEVVPDNVVVMATGRSDYPNQINNALVFPGIFRGALGVHASEINEQMKLAAAYAIADIITEDELSSEYIVPSIFNQRVHQDVARAVGHAARETGVDRTISPDEDWGGFG